MRPVEEKDIRCNRGVWRKHTVRHTDDRMEVKLEQQLLLDRYWGIIRAEQESVWQNDGATTVLLQPIHDDRHKEVCGFAATKVSREILFHALFFVAAVRRIC